MNSTGPIDTWNINPIDVGPIYPFAGWEVLMFVACLAFCIYFMVWKFRMENARWSTISLTNRESVVYSAIFSA